MLTWSHLFHRHNGTISDIRGFLLRPGFSVSDVNNVRDCHGLLTDTLLNLIPALYMNGLLERKS